MIYLVKIGIKYPKERKGKMATKRFLEKNGGEFEKISVIATVDSSIIPKLKELGNTIIELQSNIQGPQETNCQLFKVALQEFDKLFTQLAQNPKKFDFRMALREINISKIDEALEALKREQVS